MLGHNARYNLAVVTVVPDCTHDLATVTMSTLHQQNTGVLYTSNQSPAFGGAMVKGARVKPYTNDRDLIFYRPGIR